MKQTFLLDENVFIAAETVQNERQQLDRTSADLVEAIVANCHTIVLNNELFAKYSRKADAIQVNRIPSGGVRMMPLIKVIMVNPAKCRLALPQDSFPIPDEEAFHPDDLFLARLAGPSNAILVTADDRLLRNLARRGVAVQAMRPEHALPIARVAD